MGKKNNVRIKAKILRKLRWYYVYTMQENKRRLWLYRSYRYARRHPAQRTSDFGDCDFYLTKEVHPGAGIGDQLASWISGYYYANRLGIRYAHSRFYPDRWEEFLGFGEEEEKAALLCKEGYRKVVLPWFDEKQQAEWQLIRRIIASYRGQKVVFFLELHQIYTAQYGVMEALREKFDKKHPPGQETLIYHPDEINIAVHIRRGDIMQGQVTGEKQLTQRWLNNSYYIRVLEQLMPLLEMQKAAIYLFSQGKLEDFQEFEQFGNIHYCMTMPATDSFLHMVRADILITSKSSFSYKPALLSDGVRICPKDFWHGYPQDVKWVMAEEDGSLHTESLKAAVQNN